MEQRKQWKQQQKSDLNKDHIRTKKSERTDDESPAPVKKITAQVGNVIINLIIYLVCVRREGGGAGGRGGVDGGPVFPVFFMVVWLDDSMLNFSSISSWYSSETRASSSAISTGDWFVAAHSGYEADQP